MTKLLAISRKIPRSNLGSAALAGNRTIRRQAQITHRSGIADLSPLGVSVQPIVRPRNCSNRGTDHPAETVTGCHGCERAQQAEGSRRNEDGSPDPPCGPGSWIQRWASRSPPSRAEMTILPTAGRVAGSRNGRCREFGTLVPRTEHREFRRHQKPSIYWVF